MSGNFVFFPSGPTQAATISAGWDDAAIIAQLLPEQKTQMRREVRQMAEWNRRAALMLVSGLPGATASELSAAADEALRIDQWFSSMAWLADIDATLSPVSVAIDPARVATLAKIAGQAAQQLALISTVVGAFNTATILLTALKAEGVPGATSLAAVPNASPAFGMGVAPVAAPAPTAAQAPTATPPVNPAAAEAAATKAMYELVSARVTANEALIKTVLGTIPASTDAAGKTTGGDGSALLEGTLLATHTLRLSAQTVAQKVLHELGRADPLAGIILLTGTQTLEIGLWRAVQGRIAAIRKTAADAARAVESAKVCLGMPDGAPPPAGIAIATGAAIVTAIGTVVSNAANLASYFQTSYSTRGAAIDGLDDMLFVAAVASQLVDQAIVHVPGAAADEAKAHVLLEELLSLRQQAETDRTTIEQLQKALLTPLASAPGSPPVPAPPPPLPAIAAAGAAIGASNAVIQACDAILASLTTPDATGTIPLTDMSSQAALGSAVDAGAQILRLRVHKVASGIYTREDGRIRAWFRSNENDSPDLHVSGGCVISYMLQHADGRLTLAGTLRDQTPYLQLDTVDEWLGER